MARIIQVLGLAAVLCSQPLALSAQVHAVIVSDAQVPEVNTPLPVLKLGAQVVAPLARVQSLVKTVPQRSSLEFQSTPVVQTLFEGQRLVALVHPQTGQSMLIPHLDSITPSVHAVERVQDVANRLIADDSLFPKDATALVALAPVSLVGTQVLRNGQRPAAPATYLSVIQLQRRVNGIPVYGPGTQAMVGVDGEGGVHSFLHRWRSAANVGVTLTARSRPEIADAIRSQLVPLAARADIKVDMVRLAYYDGGNAYLQPVYRFDATLVSATSTGRGQQIANEHVHGYVSIGASPEPLPLVNVWPTKRRTESPGDGRRFALSNNATPVDDPTVGIYVLQHDWDAWTNRAVEFQQGLADGQALVLAHNIARRALGQAPQPAISFTNPQYFWAEPRMYTSDKDKFVNNVNIALTEGHGFEGGFVTKYNETPYPFDANKDDREDVRITDIPAPGYGSSGALAYWIIHNCNTVATEVEEPGTSFDRWWTVFNGLHAVLGFRTEGFASDNVGSNFALAISLGAPVVGSWFNAATGDDVYKDNPTYKDGSGNTLTYGRASAIAVCGHEGDTAGDIAPIAPTGSPLCLHEMWMTP